MSVSSQPETAVRDSARTIIDICAVDDDPSVLQMLEETLSRFGYRTFVTSDPEQGLEFISSGKGRIVLCDLRMPNMDGLAFLERALHADPGVYVVFM